ncbi:MAG TPA: hypothetical protein VLB85_04950 [Acidimicrobiia bacterium]|nr:hypothetical protein [Acidimicrobiia bacterium]
MRKAIWHISWALLVVGSLALNAAWPLPGQEDSRPWAMGMMAYPVVGALLLVRRPGNAIGRILATVGAAAGVIFIGGWVVFELSHLAASAYLEAFLGLAVIVMFWAAIALLYLFPTGSAEAGGPRRLFLAITAAMACLAVLGLFNPDPLPTTGRVNPLGGPDWVATTWAAAAWSLPVAVIGGLWALRRRYRIADVVVRSQLKWFMAAAIWFLLLVAVISQTPSAGRYEVLLYPVVVGAFWALPVAILLAILRYRLYEIDRLVSRSLSYSVLVLLLGGMYAAVVWVSSRLLPAGSELAVSISVLAVAVALNPLRRRIQDRVDQLFNRTRFDAERESFELSVVLRSSTELTAIVAALHGAVERTLQPTQASVWIRDDRLLGKAPTYPPPLTLAESLGLEPVADPSALRG